MKKVALISLAIFLLVSLPVAMAQTGNGAPNGAHYNLNLIGQDTCKSADMKDSNRHTIFVLLNYWDATPTDPTPIAELDRRNKIFLSEGEFKVLDGNACDGAEFQLPANVCTDLSLDPTDTTYECTYDVYIRGLGSPKKIDGESPYAQMTTCRIDTGDPDILADDEFQCSTETVTVERTKGKSTFQRVTKELTTVCLDTVLDEVVKCDTRVMLFEDEMYQYFWDYDNHGLRLAQLRFYPRVVPMPD